MDGVFREARGPRSKRDEPEKIVEAKVRVLVEPRLDAYPLGVVDPRLAPAFALLVPLLPLAVRLEGVHRLARALHGRRAPRRGGRRHCGLLRRWRRRRRRLERLADGRRDAVGAHGAALGRVLARGGSCVAEKQKKKNEINTRFYAFFAPGIYLTCREFHFAALSRNKSTSVIKK